MGIKDSIKNLFSSKPSAPDLAPEIEIEYSAESNVGFPEPNRSSIQERFMEFHQANPQVYIHLKEFALVAKYKGGFKQYSIKSLYERLRWEISMELHTKDWKLNNDFTSRYARLLMDQEPELKGFFRVRELEAA